MALPTITVKDASGANVVINTTPLGGQQVSANSLPVVLASDQSVVNFQFLIRNTYRYAALSFAPVAAPTDIIVIQGSASKTLRIKRVRLSGVATAAGNMPVQLVRRSTAGTLGSAVLTAVTKAQMDSTDSAPTGVVSTVGTANYTTLGTSAGVVGADRLQFATTGTGAAIVPVAWEFSNRFDKPPILRGTSEFLCVNLNGATLISGGLIDYEIEIEEDNS